MFNDGEVKKEDYTWELCAKDLALSTQLNVDKASSLTYQLRTDSKIHPFDAFPILKFLVPKFKDQITRDECAELGQLLCAILRMRDG